MNAPALIKRPMARAHGALWTLLAPLLRLSPSSIESDLAGAEAAPFRPAPEHLALRRSILWIALLWTVALETLLGLLLTEFGTSIAYHMLPVFEHLILPWLEPTIIILALAPVVIAILGLLTIQLRYDTTRYLLGRDSLRIRRGVLVSREINIAFANIQDATIRQGPLQRLFGIADVVVRSAGGQVTSATSRRRITPRGNAGLLEGVRDATALRDRLTDHAGVVTRSDPNVDSPRAARRRQLTRAHVEMLRLIRQELSASGHRLEPAS